MKIYNFKQYSPEWWAIRCGMPTASNFNKIITTKGKPSTQKQKYLYKLAGEFITGKTEEIYQNAAMLRGLEMEAEARKFYELVNNVEVKQVGFCVGNPDIEYGASPDGLVGDDGLLEIKCPLISTHVGYLLKKTLSIDYFQQVQGQMLVTGRKWTDLLSYYPGIRSLTIRIKRDEEFLEALEVELKIFVEELQTIINTINLL